MQQPVLDLGPVPDWGEVEAHEIALEKVVNGF